MPSIIERYKVDLDKLIKLGDTLQEDFVAEITGKPPKTKEHKSGQFFFSHYQRWYSESLIVIKQLLPERLEEFKRLYEIDSKRKSIGPATYTLQDYLLGVRSGVDTFRQQKFFDDTNVAFMRYQSQLQILRSVQARFESKLFEIKALIQADVFDSEIDVSRELLKKGFYRAAGAVSGVVLERHLSEVCNRRSITIRKKDPTINDLNGLLKQFDVIDVPTWRFVQRLGDLRNICVHNKDREPTSDECGELINGVEKAMKTIY